MTDRVTPEVRSRIMATVREKNSTLEHAVRRTLHAAGYRYRLHVRGMPGSPDMVLPKFRMVVFVHGCFWHGHDCPRGRRPSTNTIFWNAKLDANRTRDRLQVEELKDLGWKVRTVWGCEVKDGCSRILLELSQMRERDFNQVRGNDSHR
jgi:DNA mismatch endonuclease, patch repair protein